MKKTKRYKKEDFLIPENYFPQYEFGSWIEDFGSKFDDTLLGGQQSENKQITNIQQIAADKIAADKAANDATLAANTKIQQDGLDFQKQNQTMLYGEDGKGGFYGAQAAAQADLESKKMTQANRFNSQQLGFQKEQFAFQKQQSIDAKAEVQLEKNRQIQLQADASLNSRTGEFYRDGGVLGLVGNSHEEGGILTNQGNPTSVTGQEATEEMEDGEYIVQINPQLSKALKSNLVNNKGDLSGTSFDNGGTIGLQQGMDKYVLSKKNGTAKQFSVLKSKYKGRLNDDGTPNDVLSGVGYYNDLSKIIINNEEIKKGRQNGSMELKKDKWVSKKDSDKKIYANGGNIEPMQINKKSDLMEKMIAREPNLKGSDPSNIDEQMPPYKFVNVGDANQQKINWFKNHSKGNKYDAAREYTDKYLKGSKGKVVGFEGNDMYLYHMDKKTEKGDGVSRYALLPQVFERGGSTNPSSNPVINKVNINRDKNGKIIPERVDLRIIQKQRIKELEKDIKSLKSIKPEDLKRFVDKVKTESDYANPMQIQEPTEQIQMPIDPEMMGYNLNQSYTPKMANGGKLPKYDGEFLSFMSSPYAAPAISAVGGLTSGFTGLYYNDKMSHMINKDMPNQKEISYDNIGYGKNGDFNYQTTNPNEITAGNAAWNYKYQNINKDSDKVAGINAVISPELLDLSAGKQAIIDQNTQGVRGYSESIKDTLNPAQAQAANAVMRANAMKQAGQGIAGLETQEGISNQQARMQAKGMSLDLMKTNKQIEAENVSRSRQADMFNRQMGMQSAKTGLDTQMYNIGNKMRSDEFNIGTKMQNDQFNMGNRMKTDMFNTSNKFQADMFNSNAVYNSAMNRFNAKLQNTNAKGQIINSMIQGVFGAFGSLAGNLASGAQNDKMIDAYTNGMKGLDGQQSMAGANMGGDLSKLDFSKGFYDNPKISRIPSMQTGY